MALTEVIGPSVELPAEGVKDFARHQVERWCAICDAFVRWERQHIIQAVATAEERDQHRSALKWLLTTTRLMYVPVSDPDFQDRSVRKMLEVVLWKLETSWSMIYEPMSDEEADKLLAQVFHE